MYRVTIIDKQSKRMEIRCASWFLEQGMLMLDKAQLPWPDDVHTAIHEDRSPALVQGFNLDEMMSFMVREEK